jgi:hypothetical protein
MIGQRAHAGIAILAVLALAGQGEVLPVDPGRIPTGTWRYEFQAGEEYVGDLISVVHRQDELIASTSYLTGSGEQREYSLTVSASDLRPISSSVLLGGAGARPFEARMRYTLRADSLQIERTVLRQGFPEGQRLPRQSRWSVPAPSRYDNQSLDLLVQALPLAAGASWVAFLMDPTTDHPVRVTIRVAGPRTTRTPAGSFEVWRVIVRGLAMEAEYDIDRQSRVLIAQYVPSGDVRMLLKRVMP